MTGDTVTAIVVGATVAVAGVGCTAAWGTEETVGVNVATKTESENKDKFMLDLYTVFKWECNQKFTNSFDQTNSINNKQKIFK